MKKIFYAMVCLICFYAGAALSAPRIVVTSAVVKDGKNSSGNTTITASWITVDLPGNLPGNAPYSQGYNVFGFMVAYMDSGYYLWYAPAAVYGLAPQVPITSSDTWTTLANKFAAKYGSSGTATWTVKYPVNGSPYIKTCIATYNNFGSNQDIAGVEAPNFLTYDQQTCGNTTMVPTPVTCDIVGPGQIDHGTLDVSEVNGKTTTVNTNVTCSAAATIGFRIINQSIDLGLGITSQLKVNGSATPANVTVAQSVAKAVTVSSTLQATNPTAGTFSGSSTIIVDIK